MTSIDQRGWKAEQEIRNGQAVLTVTKNGDPRGLISFDGDDTIEEIDRMKYMINELMNEATEKKSE